METLGMVIMWTGVAIACGCLVWRAWEGWRNTEAKIAAMTPEERDAFNADMQTW